MYLGDGGWGPWSKGERSDIVSGGQQAQGVRRALLVGRRHTQETPCSTLASPGWGAPRSLDQVELVDAGVLHGQVMGAWGAAM